MPRLSRLNRPNTINSTSQVLSKLYGVKLFSANSTPTVISVMGPRMARMMVGSPRRILRRMSLSTWSRMSLARKESLPRSLPLIARLPGRHFAARESPVEQVYSGHDQQRRPEAHHAVEIQQIERVQEQQNAQNDQHHRGHRNLVAAAAQVHQAGI